jgi:hypothetical protein
MQKSFQPYRQLSASICVANRLQNYSVNHGMAFEATGLLLTLATNQSQFIGSEGGTIRWRPLHTSRTNILSLDHRVASLLKNSPPRRASARFIWYQVLQPQTPTSLFLHNPGSLRNGSSQLENVRLSHCSEPYMTTRPRLLALRLVI